MKLDAIVMTQLEVSEEDASGMRKYVFRVSIPASEFLYSVMAQSEAEAMLKARREILRGMRERALTSHSQTMALSGEAPALTGGVVLGIAAATLAARLILVRVATWLRS